MIELSTLQDADRLAVISQRIGFALWQLQELEGVSATYLVLSARATPAMGEEAGQALLDAALAKTFGTTVRELTKAGAMPPVLKEPVTHLLSERNWFVHNSRASSRSAVRNDAACLDLIRRIDAIASEALRIMKEFGSLTENLAKVRGMTQEEIDLKAAEILKRWRGARAL